MTRRLDATKSLVIGASGLVGSHIVRQLFLEGGAPYGLSRNDQHGDRARWIIGDLANPQTISWPDVEIIYCTASARLLADALQLIATPSLARVVLFTSTSISTKANSPSPEEREGIAAYATAEKDVIAQCNALGVAWTVLRPTIIYEEGKDRNITRLAGLIARFGFFPLYGRGAGLRQPVHAEDCGIAAVCAARSAKAANKIYDLPGREAIAYREMIGRIFDGMGRRRVIFSVPPSLWLPAFGLLERRFPGFKAEMGVRMATDLTFDPSPAIADFAWNPREFRPSFDWLAGQDGKREAKSDHRRS
jgi:nucleoside-diphosphate-sugar epimerase